MNPPPASTTIKYWLGLLVCLMGSLLQPSTALAAGESDPVNGPAFSECSIGTGASQLVAQCTNLAVPLDPLSGNSDTLSLSIARIPARRRSSRTDAFTLIAGGPGQSAIESFPTVAFAFRHIMRDHDVILIDQRGTGGSAKLDCPTAPDSLGLEFDADIESLKVLAKECFDSLGNDPRLFSTSIAVRDLETVRESLGISQWNIYGISYGTRVALHYLRRYPEAVRTMILDAVVPPELALGPEIGPLAQRALDMIFKRCSDDPGCAGAFTDLDAATLALLDSLDAEPRTITFENIATGKLASMEFTRNHLAITLRLMSYSSQTAAILPSMLHEAIVNDNFAPLARQADLQTRSLGDTLATGMHHAIICTEDEPFIDNGIEDNSDIDNSNAEPQATSYLGDAILDSLKASCALWPEGYRDEDFKQAVSSDVPTLILSGEADPITPPDYGDRVAKTLSRAKHLVNDSQGHMQAPFGCMPVLLAQFIETANSENLQTDCLERLRPTPFFVDANGPLP